MKAGFIGLGHLGRAIAGRLVEREHTLIVWNRSPGKAAGLPCTEVDSPVAVAEQVDILFLCLFDSQAVRQVLTGEKGLLAGTVSGKIIIDLSTNHFADVVAFHDSCREAGASYLESPVLGSVVPASQGNLAVLVSGARSAYEKSKPLLEDIGKHIFFLEKPALATKMKLINNLTLGSFMATIAEAVSFAEYVGMQKKDVVEILSVGGGNSLVLNAKKAKLLEEDFSTHFSTALIYKDLHCLMDLAYSEKKPLFTGAMVKEFYAKAFHDGLSQEDFSAIYKIFKK
ncbi:MAG: NAD(P)-dependent oxidoreductase [Thermodesulfobacteriota bacterium]